MNKNIKLYINGIEAEFPSKTATVGDTYRVVTAGRYAEV